MPLLNLLDRWRKVPGDRPSPTEECTCFPAFPWHLRTVIMVFPPDAPFRFLNLNVTLGLTGLPLDRAEAWRGSDSGDAFDLQFCSAWGPHSPKGGAAATTETNRQF